ncbi:hypothetical protein IGI04_003711 [Brassica rapa subsp. trilocularis]|uniref:HMA domain-containing protein n=1 Tax=Brassica rapa subsp. trilocularis TaxID=1813537 RepID=A0ABQ7P2Q5_BRACM|nr:hypothetical protein IGI04_003711 [Brassica rapa subsp. trilocularis]
MKKIVVFQFTVFDESIKERAKEIASEFPGVTKVVEVEGEGQLEVRGEFSTFELTKELMKIDESVETIKIVPDGVTEPEVKIQQQDKGQPPTNIQKTSKWPSDVASSSNGRGVQAYEFLGQAIDVAKLAKDMGVGAAKQAKDMGVGAAGKAIGLGMNYYRNKKEKDVKAQLEPKLGAEQRNIWGHLPEAQKRGLFEVEKQKKIREEEERRKKQAEEKIREEKMRKQAEEMKQKKIRDEEMRKKAEEMKQKKIREEKMRKQAEEMKQKKIREEEMRKQAEEMKQKKIREEKMKKQAEEMKQKKEEEQRRKQAEEMEQRKIRLDKEKRKMMEKDLAIKKEEEKLKIWQEKMKNSGGTTWTGTTGSLWGNLSTQTSAWMGLQTGETSASAQTQLPGRASASTQNQRLTQRRKEESRGVDKKGKNHQ